MERDTNCLLCDKRHEECQQEQIKDCLLHSGCAYCGSPRYNYPYGNEWSRRCRECGAEWSVYK